MNLNAAFQAPWRASRPASQASMLVVGVLALVGAAAAAMHTDKPYSWIVATVIVGVGAGCMWGSLLANTVLLAIDAQQLRLPGVKSSVALSVWLYGLFCVALPTALLTFFGGRPEVIAVFIAMCCLTGFVFSLLPVYLALLLGFMPMILQTLSLWPHLTAINGPAFMRWAAPTVIALMLVAANCWHRLVSSGKPYEPVLGQPLVMRLRFAATHANSGDWGALSAGGRTTDLIRKRPNWMQPTISLRSCGPAQPTLAMRVALGSVFMPRTIMSWLRQCAYVLAPGLLLVLLMAVPDLQRHGVHGLVLIWHDFDLLVLVWLAGFASMMLGLVCLMQLTQSRQKPNAEVSLLALMPGLGNGRQLKHNLVRASLLPPLRIQILGLAITLLTCIAIGSSLQTVWLVLLGQLGAMGFVVAFTLAILGDRPLPPSATFACILLGCMLIFVCLFVPTMSDISKINLHAISLAQVLVVGWGVLTVFLLWLGRRGWRGLQQRPHPFLVD